MTAAQDAAVLYFALHGTDAPLTCRFLVDHPDPHKLADNCGRTLAGLDHGDGCALCAEHVRSEGGHLLSEEVLAELWLVKRTWECLRKQTPEMHQRVLRGEFSNHPSNLEAFALRVAGIDPTADTERPPPPTGEDDPNESDLSHFDPRDGWGAHTDEGSPKHTNEARIRGHLR